MADKELRRMKRADLIEIIYELRKSELALQEENAALKEQLEDKRLRVSKVGSLAELSADLNGLFTAAQATADQYLGEISSALAHIRQLEAEAESKAGAGGNDTPRPSPQATAKAAIASPSPTRRSSRRRDNLTGRSPCWRAAGFCCSRWAGAWCF